MSNDETTEETAEETELTEPRRGLVVAFRTDPDTYVAMKLAAYKEGRTISGWLKWLVKRAITNPKDFIKPPPTALLLAILTISGCYDEARSNTDPVPLQTPCQVRAVALCEDWFAPCRGWGEEQIVACISAQEVWCDTAPNQPDIEQAYECEDAAVEGWDCHSTNALPASCDLS